MSIVQIKDFGLYGERGNIETEEQLKNEIVKMCMMVASCEPKFYENTNNKILLIDEFVEEIFKYIKNELAGESFLFNLIKCAKECLNIKTDKEVLQSCIDRFNWVAEEDGTLLIYSVKDAIDLLEEINNLLALPEKWFSPIIYKKLGEFLKTFNCERTKYKKRVAFKNKGEFSNEQILKIGKNLNGVSLSSKFDFFPTPEELVYKIQDLAEIKEHHTVLEPSAGTGSLLSGINNNNIKCVEVNEVLASILEEKKYVVFNEEFEQFKSEEKFDRIIMNPPFSKRLDAKHILKAFNEHLNNSGVLVAIHSSGIVGATDKHSKQFQELYNQYGVCQIEVKEGVFKESGKGTNIKTYISKFIKN